MTIADLLKPYRYNHYSNPDNLTYKDDETSDPVMAVKVDGTYYFLHESSLRNCLYEDCGLSEVLDCEVETFSQQINLDSRGLSHSLVIITKR